MNCLITPFSQCFTSILPSAHGLFVDLSTSDIEILITAPLPRGRPPKAAQLTRQRAGRPDRNAWRDVTRAWKALTISARPTRSEQRTCCCGCPWTRAAALPSSSVDVLHFIESLWIFTFIRTVQSATRRFGLHVTTAYVLLVALLVSL